MNQKPMESRVIQAAEQTLSQQHYVSAIDVLVGIGLLQPIHVQEWRNGKVPYLERVIQGNLKKISYAMKCFRKWATHKALKPTQTNYLRQTPGSKKALQFSKSGNPDIERAYYTHYVSPQLSEKRQQKIQEKNERLPDPLVFIIVKDSQCSRCQKELYKSSFLFIEAEQPLCLSCAGLDKLVFLPSGNMLLTRRAKKYSSSFCIVVKFSHARKRYERQGLLIEETALKKAQQELED